VTICDREEGRMVLSEAVPDSAASEGAAIDNLEGKTGSEKEKERRGTGRGCGLGLNGRGRGLVTSIAIGCHQDFGSSTIGCSTGGGVGKIEIGIGARVAVVTRVPVKKKIRKQEDKSKNKRTYHGPD